MTDQRADNDRLSGLLVVVCGPSGVGKTTIVHAARDRLGGAFSVSSTTRPKSDQERHGIDYFFISDDEFTSMIHAGEFLEHAEVFGRHRYGTPRRPVEEAISRGEIFIRSARYLYCIAEAKKE